MTKTLYAWKFLIGKEPVPKNPKSGISYENCVAVVIATTRKAAKERLLEFANRDGIHTGWLKYAQVTRLNLDADVVVTWVA